MDGMDTPKKKHFPMTTNVSVTIPIERPNGTIEIIEVMGFQTQLKPYEIYMRLLKVRD